MGFFDRFRSGEKSVDISFSDGDNFTRNMVSVRTITYSDGSYLGGSYSQMYRRQPAVRSVVDFLARNIGQLNPKVYERVSDTDRVEVNDHPLAKLLHNPNLITTRYAFLRDTVADLAIYDRAYWRKFRSGRAFQIVRIPVSKLSVETAQNGVTVYRLANGETIERGQLVIFHGYSPDGDSDGVSPLETLRSVLAEESSSISSRQAMWNNFARNGGVIERPTEAPPWSDEARNRFRSDWDDKFAGSSNAGKTPVLEEGMTWKDTSVEAPVDDYIEGRRLTREEVAITYFGPIAGRAFLQATGTGTDATHRQIYQDVLGPWLRMLQDEIELQLLPEFEPIGGSTYVEFNLAEKLKGSFEEQAEVLTTSVGVPVLSVNEGRARLNVPRIDEAWADTPVQPLNVMYGGQPAVQIPTADPGTPGQMALPDLADVFTSHFDRQARSGKALDRPRWDRELTADLVPFFGEQAEEFAKSVNDRTSELLELAGDDPDVQQSVFVLAQRSADRLAQALTQGATP